MIERQHLRAELRSLLAQFPVVGLIGARQVGKTTLARQFAAESGRPVHVFDLENPGDLARMAEPWDALEPLRGLVVIDEIHRRPEFFPTLRVLADRRPVRTRFLVLGSASVELLRQSSESLAGRIAYLDMPGLSIAEVGAGRWQTLWSRGGFPRSFVARGDAASLRWRRDFMRTFLERDVRTFGIGLEPQTLQRFWRMLAHYHGQVWNSSEFARSFGVSDMTVRRYLDALHGLLVVRRLQPWFENLGKRQIKSPKVYVADSGLLHALLDVPNADILRDHPKSGASLEGFAIDQIVTTLGLRWEDCYYWGVHSGAELDLVVRFGVKRYGFEVKYTSAPHRTRSMQSAIDALKLDRIFVIHTGEHAFAMGERVEALPITELGGLAARLQALARTDPNK